MKTGIKEKKQKKEKRNKERGRNIFKILRVLVTIQIQNERRQVLVTVKMS